MNTHGKCLSSIKELCSSNHAISEIYLDFEHQNFTRDLKTFLSNYPSSNLKVLEINRMDDPVELGSPHLTPLLRFSRIEIIFC